MVVKLRILKPINLRMESILLAIYHTMFYGLVISLAISSSRMSHVIPLSPTTNNTLNDDDAIIGWYSAGMIMMFCATGRRATEKGISLNRR
jgi:hypothetical protein